MVEHSGTVITADVTTVWRNETPVHYRAAQRRRRLYLALKRVFDVTVAITVLVSLSPLLLVIALLIKLDSDGPVLFAQRRVGYDPRTRTRRDFTVYKFRTMQNNADTRLHQAHVANLIKNRVSLAPGQQTLKLTNDRRITRVGHFLRESSLDELPQLINMLKGEMSLIGPRPALPYEVDLYEEWHKRRLEALPGLTGWWQVKGRSRVSFDEMVRMDVEYIEHQGVLLDLEILLRTPWAVISGKGAG
jgi:lipopolysaccharide/colanic/teichoic acid biosynthesis glycosyltransferase